MPTMQNLVLTDRAATPVAHTFVPKGIQGAVATVVEAGATPTGDNTVTITSTKTASGRSKVKLSLAMPVVATETINGVSSPKLLRTNYVNVEFSFDAFSLEVERNNIVGMMADALGVSKTLVNDTVVKLQGIY